jgi:hypothetical protein
MTDRTVASVLDDAAQTLQTAEWGLTDFTGADPRRRTSGLRNLVVFGRAVTNVLQNLRTVVGVQAFNEWYEPWQEKMRKDELLKYFYQLRTEILKEGALKTTTSVHIANLNTRELQPLMQNPPPVAKGFFIGDHLNGSGWEVELPDGSVVKYYVMLPNSVQNQITMRFHFPDAPRTHDSHSLQDPSVEQLAQLYIRYLQNLVAEARTRFNS